jgi:hypothetical protein
MPIRAKKIFVALAVKPIPTRHKKNIFIDHGQRGRAWSKPIKMN